MASSPIIYTVVGIALILLGALARHMRRRQREAAAAAAVATTTPEPPPQEQIQQAQQLTPMTQVPVAGKTVHATPAPIVTTRIATYGDEAPAYSPPGVHRQTAEVPLPTPLEKIRSLETIAAMVNSPSLLEASAKGEISERILRMPLAELQNKYGLTTDQFLSLKRYRLELEAKGLLR
ncbi:hypothetical protein BDZ88DRAFT_442905 [Geranomyces variabilis]|nr:hypothetical protein BDZ88DRAFT_442905 [Geranomyces variabilis]